MPNERIATLDDLRPEDVPYFSLIVVPAPENAFTRAAPTASEQHGTLRVLGLGPGAAEWISPEATRALREATDLVGYQPYLDRVPLLPGQRRHGSDNRVELQRAQHALALAANGAHVCVVSSGDPGIFAMAGAVMEAIEHGPTTWRDLDVRVIPGISAMQAAAARAGAPLGHDFCVISLSDRLKPWNTIAQRLEAAARADFALALYNPISSQRRHQLREARDILLRHRAPHTPVILAHDLGGTEERIRMTTLADFSPGDANMRTTLLIGSSTTRSFTNNAGRRFVYTPRRYDEQR
jgi:precorrin-2 C20-methyltransferase/precorrin-3B C17-methyltransferase